MSFCFRFGHPAGDLQLRAVRRDNGIRAIGAPRLARDVQRLTVERMKPIVNGDTRTYGIMDGAAAIATSSMITELAKGLFLDDALKLTRNDVADALDGLPPVKMHCSNLAADALHDAIMKYKKKSE